MDSPRSSLVIVIDRWGAGYVGAYGNTWLETPAVNRLAGESLLLENAFADSPTLAQCYRGYWTALPAAMSERTGERGLSSELAAAGIPSELITDELEIADSPLAAGFDEKLVIPTSEVTGPAVDAASTHFGMLLAAASERLQDPTPRLVWLHARGLAGPWDAPREYRAQFRDEEDPEPLTDWVPPDYYIDARLKPDEVLGWVHAYAGQIAAMDLCLDAFLGAFRASAWAASSLLVFASPRGYPLGEHGRIGPCDHALYEELLHVPLLLRRGDGQGALAREQQLVQPADLGATLRDWFGLACPVRTGAGQSVLPLLADDYAAPLERPAEAPSQDAVKAVGDESPSRDILIVGPDQRALRTRHWFWRGVNEQDELFAKPDDRWEVNEVSRRCPDEAVQLRQRAEQLERELTELSH